MKNQSLAMIAAAALFGSIIVVTSQEAKAAVTYSIVFACGNGPYHNAQGYWYYYNYCQYEYVNGQWYATWLNQAWYRWTNFGYYAFAYYTGWHVIDCVCFAPVLLLYKVNQTATLIKTNMYKGDVVGATCTVTSDNDAAKTFAMTCHDLNKLPAGTNSTNPQHLQQTADLKPFLSWGPSFTPPPS